MSYERVYAGETTVFSGKLETAAGAAVTAAQVSDLRLSLVDSCTGSTVNSRDGATNHKTTPLPNVTLGTSDGIVEWEAQPADTALLDPVNGGEDHQMALTVTFDASDGNGVQVEEFRHRIYGATFLGLTGMEEIDMQIGEDPNRSDNDRFFLELMIDAVTARLEMVCDRTFLKATAAYPAVQILSPDENCWAVDLKRWPVTKSDIVSVKHDGDGVFGESITAYDSTSYGMSTPRSLRKKSSPWPEGVESLRVEHTGGYSRHTGGVDPHVRHAVAMQIGTWWSIRDKLGIQAESVQGANVTTFFRGGLIKEVQDLIPYLSGRLPG